jgi:hypothetical protein
MIHVNVNAGWRAICRAVRGMHERCVSSGRNSSVFELIWTADARERGADPLLDNLINCHNQPPRLHGMLHQLVGACNLIQWHDLGDV